MMKKILKIRKNKIIPIIIISFFFIIYEIYLNKTAENIIYMDQVRMTVNILGKYYDGILKIQDLYLPYLEHQNFFYHIWFLLNAIYFKLNTLLDINIGGLLLLFTSIIFFKKVFDDSKLNDRQKFFLFVSLGIILYSLNKWEFILLGIIVDRATFFLLQIIFLYNLDKTKLRLFILGIFIGIFFSFGYYVIYLVSILFLEIYLFIKNKEKKCLKNILLISLIIIISKTWNFYINSNQINVKESLKLSLNVYDYMKFYILGLSGSVLGIETLQNLISLKLRYLLGVLILIIYLYTFYLIVKHKEDIEKNKFYIVLLLYTLIFMAGITISRINYGISYGMSSRYTFDTMLGLIPIYYYFIRYNKNKLILVLLSGIIIFSSIEEFKKSIYRKEYYKKMQSFAEEETNLYIFQSSDDLTKRALKIIKENNLNFTLISNLEVGKKIGWYEDNWLKCDSEIILKSSEKNILKIEGYYPENFLNNDIEIYINDSLKYKKILNHGVFNLALSTPKDEIFTLKIILKNKNIPQKLGINTDERELGIKIESIRFE